MKYDAVILAGGQSMRMGRDKGLMPFEGQTMIDCVANALQGAEHLWVNTNEHVSEYQSLGFQTLQDVFHQDVGRLAGPLLGILTGLQNSQSDWVLFSPCDTPNLPNNYAQLMVQHASAQLSYANVAYDGERQQNLHLLLHRSLSESLLMYLLAGGRKTYQWLEKIKVNRVDFSNLKEGFKNINSPADL